MSNEDLTFGVALKNTGSDNVPAVFRSAREEAQKLKQATDELAAASVQSAKQQAVSADDMMKYWTGLSIAESDAKDKAWALANGYQEVGGKMVKTVEDVASAHKTNSVAVRESLVLMREAAVGNWSRMAGSASILANSLGAIPFLLNPITLGIAGVTAVLGAGAYEWQHWAEKEDEAAAASEKFSASINKTAVKLEDQIALLRQRASLSAMGVTGQSDDETKQIVDLQLRIRTMNQDLKDGVKIQEDGFFTTEKIVQLQTQLNRLLDDQKEKQALIAKQKEDGPGLLKDAQRLDAQMVESHKSSFDKTLDEWIKMQQKMTDAGIYYGKVREDHEAAYTAFVNAENAKKNAEADAAEKKRDQQEAAHLATRMANENLYFSQVAAATAKSEKSLQAAEEKRFKDETAAWQKRYEQAQNDHALSLAEEQAFQNAIFQLTAAHNAAMTQLNQQQALADLATLGSKSRAFFEISKLASVADIIMSGGKRAEASAAWAATWGGPIAAGIAEALSWAATAINVQKVESTPFGGATVSSSGGVASFSAPSNTPSIPVSVKPTASTAVSAQLTQQFNYTIIGAKDNPDKAVVSFNAAVAMLDALNQAAAKGYKISAKLIPA